MTTSHIDFASRFAGPETFVVCVLIAGVPLVLVPAGTAPTATAVSSGSVDALWWPGTGALTYDLPGSSGLSPVRAWLDPDVVWEVYKKTDVLKGDAKVEALTFDLFDASGVATAVLSGARARVGQLLAADITSTATSIVLAGSSGVPSSGIAWIGREALIYDGLGSSTLTLTSPPAARGAFGARARGHRADPSKPPLVTFGDWPRYLYGRTTSVWLCRLSGTTLYDPTCLYLGTVGPGVQRTPKGGRWSIPVDNVVEVLSRKIARRTVSLFGISHLDTVDTIRDPLAAGQRTFLGSSSNVRDAYGWHPNAADFIRAWQAQAVVYADTVTAGFSGDHLSIREVVGAGGYSAVTAAWDDPIRTQVQDENSDGAIEWLSRRAMPDTCVHFDGKVPLPFPGDSAKIPSTLAYSVDTASASYTLAIEETTYGDALTARIDATGTNGTLPWAAVAALEPPTDESVRQRRVLVTKRTEATMGVVAEGTVTNALQAAALALDALDGGLYEDGIDWAQIASALASVGTGGLPSTRLYRFGDGDTILDALSHELRLRGMAFCTRWGRLAAFRTAVFAATEETVATIVETDILCDDNGTPIEPDVIDAAQPIATSVLFTLPDKGSYQWVDDTARAEFGDGAEITCKALESVPLGTDLSRIGATIQDVAQQLLGVLAEPYRTVRVTLGPPFLGLQEGDLVVFTHPRVPTTSGTIGVTAATCQVQEVRTMVMGGKGRVQAALRLQEPDLAGYAPSALIAAGGALHASTTITVDTSTLWGATCFARATRPDGSTATNALDGFTAGDYVRLVQIGTRSPITAESFTIVSLDTAAGTVVLSAVPSAAMETAAAGQYGCMLVFDTWNVIDAAAATPRDRQERYAFTADHTAQDLGGGDSPKRWAA